MQSLPYMGKRSVMSEKGQLIWLKALSSEDFLANFKVLDAYSLTQLFICICAGLFGFLHSLLKEPCDPRSDYDTQTTTTGHGRIKCALAVLPASSR